MRFSAALLVSGLVTLVSSRSTAAQAPARPTAEPKLSFAEPGIAPNGAEIAFVHGGDIWVVPARGGEARLLVAHPANESRPIYSPDGSRLAFVSNRAGSPDVWILTLADASLRRLTFDDGNEQLDGWSRDGRWIYYSTSVNDIAGMTDVYRVRSDGGTPMPVAADRFAAEFMSAPSPDGQAMAIVGRGFGLSQWWRKGHSHLDESELWLVRGDGSAAPRYEQLTQRGAKQQWPMWGGSGAAASLYFVSDRSGAQNLWVKPPQGDARSLTTFGDGRVMWPTITADGNTIAFERDFGIWTYDVASRNAREVPITVRSAAIGGGTEHLVLTQGFSDLSLSPDGKKFAFIARGEVFAASAADGGDATRITTSPAVEVQVTWAADSRRLAYAANRDGAWNIYLYDFTSNKETQLTTGRTHSVSPRFSPDGRQVAFLRDAHELCVVSVDGKQVRVLAQGVFGRPPFFMERPIAWSPDGRWIAYLSGGTKLFMNAYIVPSAGGDARQVSWLANTRANSLSWSGDGAFLLLDTGMRTEPGSLARVDLLPFSPKFREDQFTALFRDETPGRTTPPTPAPTRTPTDSTRSDSSGTRRAADARNVRIVFDGIRTRLSLVPVGVDVGTQALSADGKQVIVTSNVAGQTNLFAYAFDEFATDPAVTRQITTTPGNKGSIQFAPDGKSVWFLEQGRIVNVTLENRTVKQVAVRAELDVDFAREKWDVFYQAWEYLNDNFYDPEFHGTNWPAVRTAYAPRIAGAKTPDEMRRVLSLMVGDMDASHMGVSAPPPPGAPTAATGRLGLEFDRAAYEQRGQLRVTAVIPNAAAALSEGVKVGDYVLAIDGTAIGPNVSLDSLLAFKVGRRVAVRVAADPAGANAREVAIRPRNTAFDKQMRYRAWIEERRAIVARSSNGRFGYVHMADMGGNALNQLNLDLDAEMHEKDAVVFDVRNNNGGFMNGHALDVLQRQPYVNMVRRGVPSVPGRPVLGQRALEKPTILITSQATLSDGENFTQGYRTMKLGTVVGEPTAMWDVYTGGGTMVDGTTVRLPFMRNAQLDNAALERASRQVDIPVDRPMGESYTGRDAQLERAVQELMNQVRAARTRAGSAR